MDSWLRRFGSYGQLPGNDPTKIGYFIKTADKSLVVSILSAGTLCVWKRSIAPKLITDTFHTFLASFGALFASPMSQYVGRKWGIIAATAIFSLGVGMQNALNWGSFIAGRFFAGMGVGLVSTLVPMYQSECSPKSVRGFIVGLYVFSCTLRPSPRR